jgi:hypothetical protein
LSTAPDRMLKGMSITEGSEEHDYVTTDTHSTVNMDNTSRQG